MSFTLDPRKEFDKKLVELGSKNDKILAVSCDSAAGGGLSGFFNAFPKRSLEIGISEQNAVSMCAAISKQGLIPVLVIINPFLTMRAYEQVRYDLGYMNTNVKIVGSGGGLAYSTLGSTHIALEDIALMNTVPNLTIFSPGDADEVSFALEQAIEIEGPVYIRMPRQARPLPKDTELRQFQAFKAEILQKGDDVTIFAYGPSVGEAVKAHAILKEQGVSCSIVDMMTVKPLDREAVKEYTTDVKLAVSLEEHIPEGGLGAQIAKIIAEENICVPYKIFAVPEGSKNTGPYDELVDYYGLSGNKVAKKILDFLNK
jgi:transketolase